MTYRAIKFFKRNVGKFLLNYVVFSEFPSGCSSYYGSHSLPCYETLWKTVGCSVDGFSFPPQLTITELNTLDGLNLRSVQMKGFVLAKAMGTFL